MNKNLVTIDRKKFSHKVREYDEWKSLEIIELLDQVTVKEQETRDHKHDFSTEGYICVACRLFIIPTQPKPASQEELEVPKKYKTRIENTKVGRQVFSKEGESWSFSDTEELVISLVNDVNKIITFLEKLTTKED